MSTQNWGFSFYGLVFDEDELKGMCEKAFNDFNEHEFDDDPMGYAYRLWEERGIIDVESEFSGDSSSLLFSDESDQMYEMFSKAYYSEPLYYFMLRKQPNLFRAAYSSMDDVVDELKESLGKYLPENYDYKNKICHVSGSYYG